MNDPTPTPDTPSVEVAHSAGVGFFLPGGWEAVGQALTATQFVSGAECISGRIVDREAPAGSGQAPFLYQSVVQVCAQAAEGHDLDSFMTATYGTGHGGFKPASVGAFDGYSLPSGTSSTAYFAHDSRIFQVVTSVAVEDPETEATRLAQVESILESFSPR